MAALALPSVNAFFTDEDTFQRAPALPPTPTPSPSPSPQTSVCCIEVRNLKRHAGCSRGQKQQGSFVKPVMGSYTLSQSSPTAHSLHLLPSREKKQVNGP